MYGIDQSLCSPVQGALGTMKRAAAHLPRRRRRRRVLRQTHLLALTIAVCFVYAIAGVSSQSLSPTLQLKQVHVVTRHGARTTLSKHATTLNENTYSTLTALGRQQMYDLGSWLRKRYIQLNSGVTPEWLARYDPSHARFRSSGLDRTLVSANMLAEGLYPPVQSAAAGIQSPFSHSIPVFSSDPSNDITIRSYNNCPAFQDRLSALYQSDEWNLLQNKNNDLLTQLGASFPDEVDGSSGMVELENLWNVYDQIHVAKTECDEAQDTANCLALPDPNVRNAVDDKTWERVTRLAQLLEHEKYSQPVFANMLGSNLMWEIFDTAQYDNEGDGVLFSHYSAHYPTILGLMAALGVQLPGITTAIPDYASALIIEVYEEDKNDFFFRVVYKDGSSNTAAILPLRFCYGSDSSGPADGTCPLRSVSVLQQSTFATQEEWCVACQNVQSDVCVRNELSKARQVSSQPDSTQTNAGAIVGAFVAGAVLGLLIFGVTRSLCCRPKPMNRNDEVTPPITDKVDQAEMS